jgi:hypothetical protein
MYQYHVPISPNFFLLRLCSTASWYGYHGGEIWQASRSPQSTLVVGNCAVMHPLRGRKTQIRSCSSLGWWTRPRRRSRGVCICEFFSSSALLHGIMVWLSRRGNMAGVPESSKQMDHHTMMPWSRAEEEKNSVK